MGTQINDFEEEAREIRRQLDSIAELRRQHRKRGIAMLLDYTMDRKERERVFDALRLTQVLDSEEDENIPKVFTPNKSVGMSVKEARG